MDKRSLLAIGVCIAIFVLWFWVVNPLLFPPQKQPPPAPRPPAPPSTAVVPATDPIPVQPEGKAPEFPVLPPVEFATARYRVRFTNVGAGIASFTLLYPDAQGAVPLLAPHEPGRPHLALRHANGPDAIERLPWKLVEQTDRSVEYSFPLRNGVEISKKFTIDPEKHLLELLVHLQNKSAPDAQEPPDRALQLEILAFNGLEHDNVYRLEQYLTGFGFVGRGVDLRQLPAVEKGEKELAQALRITDQTERQKDAAAAEANFLIREKDLDWFGLKNRFFAVLLDPADQATRLRLDSCAFRSSSADAFKSSGNLKNLNASARLSETVVGGKPVALRFTAYLGPIRKDALRELPEADALLNYGSGCGMGCGPVGGLFYPLVQLINLLAPVILALLNFFGRLFGNYGVAIILTTVIIRCLVFPLSKKSQTAAYRMQALGPKVQILRERYKDDQQKMGVEQMKLFREHKINPLSGCLPMFLQLPVFVAMFSVFELSIELRKQPFLLWITDLSVPDALLDFGANIDIPLVPIFNSLNILPIIMTITWFLQAFYAPRSPDPQMQTQQKMMMAMPIVFGVMCYSYASGLSLYFLVNSLLAMGEQKLIKKFFLKPIGGATST